MNATKVQKQEDDSTVTTFETTPAMSTYLVAFMVSDYKNQSTNDGVFNVWTKPHALNSTNYGLEMGQLVMKELEDFTKIPYKNHKMTKIDQVTVPDFSAGAMENWGIVMYR